MKLDGGTDIFLGLFLPFGMEILAVRLIGLINTVGIPDSQDTCAIFEVLAVLLAFFIFFPDGDGILLLLLDEREAVIGSLLLES